MARAEGDRNQVSVGIEGRSVSQSYSERDDIIKVTLAGAANCSGAKSPKSVFSNMLNPYSSGHTADLVLLAMVFTS